MYHGCMSFLETGLDTFGDVTLDATGSLIGRPRHQEVVEQAALADRVG
jgi:hypothetical protein